MASLPQAANVKVANDVAQAMVQLSGIRDFIGSVITSYTANGVDPVLQAMATVSLNADGTLGTEDVSPTTGHPINPTKVTGFTQVQSAYNYGAAYNLLQQVYALLTGNTVSQQSGAPDLLASFHP